MTLAPGDVPRDYQALVDYARGGRSVPVLLVGVSEGAGLSVLAASEPRLQASLLGVLGLGLPDVNELGRVPHWTRVRKAGDRRPASLRHP